MTSNDVMRLYALLDNLRAESAKNATELRDEVKGYRADLNGRLRTLEQAEAKRTGVDTGRGSVGRLIVSVAAVSAAVGSLVGVLVSIF